ncbi:MAG: SDR family NAD(P)-dependent oxidoreductase [Rubrivivax sp.]|nr:SDR family NAD(P)-dependent oxidoreductase [Rubrivivax sp.]
MTQALVIGATGDVGRGITAELLKAGWKVMAVGRSAERLQALHAEFKGLGALDWQDGSVNDATAARALWRAVDRKAGAFDAVITSINGQLVASPMATADAAVVREAFEANVVPHLVAAQTFIPALLAGAAYIAIGGGMADLVVPGRGAVSLCQAAQRMMFRYLALEMKDRGVRIHELMLYAMISGRSKVVTDNPHVLTEGDVGRHVVDVLNRPDLYSEPILTLKPGKPSRVPSEGSQPGCA